jgi:hypothetical protein
MLGGTIMKQRLPLILAATALLVALLGSTPLGRAAESAMEQVVPRAKKADFAANAGKLNGHKSSINPRRGQIPVVGANGKLAASIGAVGPKGDPGPQGAQGPQGGPGVSGYLRVTENITVPDGNATPNFGVSCPGGRSVLAGGYTFRREHTDALFVFESQPASNSSGWQFRVSNETGGAKPMTLFAVCANVAS